MLKVVPIGKAREGNHKAIAKGLKAIRKDAKKGRIKAIGMVVVHEDGELVYGTLGEGGWSHLTAGAFCLAHDLARGQANPGTA